MVCSLKCLLLLHVLMSSIIKLVAYILWPRYVSRIYWWFLVLRFTGERKSMFGNVSFTRKRFLLTAFLTVFVAIVLQAGVGMDQGSIREL
jgi:hypothetical protein